MPSRRKIEKYVRQWADADDSSSESDATPPPSPPKKKRQKRTYKNVGELRASMESKKMPPAFIKTATRAWEIAHASKSREKVSHQKGGRKSTSA